LFAPLHKFAFEYVDKNRVELSTWTIDEFIRNFDKDKKITTTFLHTLQDFNLSEKIKHELSSNLKALVARNLFNDEGLYRFNQKDDKMIQKVLELENKENVSLVE
jgi:carboxyl-terminal processing protease